MRVVKITLSKSDSSLDLEEAQDVVLQQVLKGHFWFPEVMFCCVIINLQAVQNFYVFYFM